MRKLDTGNLARFIVVCLAILGVGLSPFILSYIPIHLIDTPSRPAPDYFSGLIVLAFFTFIGIWGFIAYISAKGLFEVIRDCLFPKQNS